MNRTTLARRYAPLAVALAVQLIIIVTAPSTAQKSTSLATAGNGFSTGGTGGEGSGAQATGPETANGVSGGSAASAGGTTGVAAGSAGALPPGVANTGDTSHCAGGREFDPNIAYWAPPCVPGTPGGAYPKNGGATGPGVTADSITVVDYISNYGAEVNAILKAQGQLVTADDAKPFDAAMQNFINKHYVLYGRKLKIITYQGTCQSVPPDLNCLIPEMDRVIDTYHPYIVQWLTTLCSACFHEIARRGVVAFGGDGFSDEFANGNAPYFYTGGESATRVESAFGEWWCKQMSSVNNPSRKVRYAETNNPAQNFNGQGRRLGVISTNDPDNKATVGKVLGPALAKCGDKIWHTYFYDQNINTAAQQVESGINAMDTPTNPATTVLCLCETVAPAFLLQGEQQHNYYPENLIASDQTVDWDTTGQNYEQPPSQAGLACPTPSQGCEFDLAFGLSTEGPQEGQTNDEGLRIFKDGGGTSLPPDFTPINASLWVRYYSMWANFIENTGPNLTAANMQARAPSLPPIGGGTTGKPLLQVSQGNWDWIQDVRVVYWDKHAKSNYNGQPGTYVQIEGSRFDLGQLPDAPNGPDLPGGRTP